MDSKTKPRGRPRKKKDLLRFSDFARAGMVMSAYDEARRAGHKHSVAVRQAVEFVNQRNARIRVSETTVKRILVQWRPKGRRVIFLFERSAVNAEQADKHRWVLEQLKQLSPQRNEAWTPPSRPDGRPSNSGMRFTFRMGERPTYPRHNRKSLHH